MSLSFKCLFLLTLVCAILSSQAQFLSQCTSKDDYGWPRFESQSILEGDRWAVYFKHVYNELPSQYPVCVYDFWYINATAYWAAGLNGTS